MLSKPIKTLCAVAATLLAEGSALTLADAVRQSLPSSTA